MLWISVALSLLTMPLIWLLIPGLLFPPLALVLAWLGWRRHLAQGRRNYLYALPMLLALAAGGLSWYVLSTGYKA